MLRTASSLTLLATAALAPNLALAQGKQDFTLVNRTGYQIDEVYVGPVNQSHWGQDVMGKDAIANGDTADITFNGGSNACKWDIKVVYNDGDESEFRGVNLCDVSKVTLFWNRSAGETRFVVE
ncbi:exported protein of unknown function [Methylorubrum extorquens]|uniref:Argininosuccinate lyase n=1 Tax=Methylorubrum extorquens TaxID=408 RepID=A0A2N9AYC9_METEX|nr:hypothetical protein [Methylorubrum zatmanii]ARO54412.1 hypothetical protein B2G69_09800 [Methylorubrum zatmanii]KQQ15874.1 hypothetical protein ASF59_14340 [Methylobacterium sp. Leaf121]SOR32298.1 exported protein of unknown function [Methylorubrum extorquens]